MTGILIKKAEGKMILVSDSRALKTYDIDLGFSPTGHKIMEGDGRTPEGTYRINRKNPQSLYHRSLGIDYPNARDHQEATRLGVLPGGDIFIHGEARHGRGKTGTNWTKGCIAVPDREIEEIYALVAIGTPVTILP